MSVADHLKLHEHMDAAREAQTMAARYTAWSDAIAVGLVRFGDGDWKSTLTPSEAGELLELILLGAQPEGDDLGNSGSPSDTDAGASTTTA
ncbi:MAG: hypothetical protein AAGA29_04985 [Planctomycetota bacterium]